MPHWPNTSDSDNRWSTPIGAWLGVSVRVHITLVMALVLAIGLAVQNASFELGLAIAVYLASLALHEAAHVLAAWREKGDIERVVLSLVGGLEPHYESQHEPQSRVFIAMAGPMANLAVVVLGVFCLTLHEEPLLGSFFLPQVDANFQPSLGEGALVSGAPIVALAKLAVWINWPLFVLNLLPAFPFDGGEAIRSLLSPRLGSITASEMVRRGAFALGLMLIVTAPLFFAVHSSEVAFSEKGLSEMAQGSIGLWPTPVAVLAVLGVLICFGSHRDQLAARDERTGILGFARDTMGFDLGDDLLSDLLSDPFDDDQMVLLELSRHAGEESPLSGPHFGTSAAPNEHQLDKVLAKVHEQGLQGLTAEERALLQRASDNFRRRREG